MTPPPAAPLPCLCGHPQGWHDPDEWSGLEYCRQLECDCYAYRATEFAPVGYDANGSPVE